MDYNLAKKLKDSGFPKEKFIPREGECGFSRKKEATLLSNGGSINEGYYYPALSELIEACGDKFYGLHRMVNDEWIAFMYDIEDSTRQIETKGDTPEEATANLWLELNKK